MLLVEVPFAGRIWGLPVLTALTPSKDWCEQHKRRYRPITQLSLSRLTHRPPRGLPHPEIMQRTADFHHQITDARLPQSKPIFDNATALDTAVDMLNPKAALIQ
jgi:hypothetical protein